MSAPARWTRRREPTFGDAADLPWAGADPVELADSFGIPLDARRITGQSRPGEERLATPPRWLSARERTRPPASRLRRAIAIRSLAVADAGAMLSVLIALAVAGVQPLAPLALLALPSIVLLAKAMGLYDRDDVVIIRSTLDEAPALFQLATLTAMVGWAANAGLGHVLGGASTVAAWLWLFVALVVARAVAREFSRRVAPVERLILVGDESTYLHLRGKLEAAPGAGTCLVGWVPLHTQRADSALGNVADLPEIIGAHDVHRVVVSASHGSEEMLQVVRLMKILDVRVSLLPRMLEVVGTALEFEELRGVPLMGVRPFGLSRSSEVLKRATDVLAATLGLIVLGPLLLVIALAIKLDSRGPVFFHQRRVGRGGRHFDMLKFRSMVADAEARKAEVRHLNEAEGLFKIADDPRITRVGRLLRATSLDEMPQLINVLRGEMSLVGPRPLVLDEDAFVEGWHRQRLRLTPGMTGPWQVLGSSRTPLREMVTIDYLYVANWSLWNDVKILLRTIPLVLGRQGQ